MPAKNPSSTALTAEIRGLKLRATIAMILAALALGLAWAGQRSTRVVAESIALRDAEGRARAVLELDEAGEPRLVFYDAQKHRRMQLGLAPGTGAGLVLLDAEDRPQLALGATRAGPQLSLFDGRGALRALLGAGTATDPASGEATELPVTLSILDEQGVPVYRAP